MSSDLVCFDGFFICYFVAAPVKNRAGDVGDLGDQRLQQCLRVTLPGEVCTLSGPELKELRLRSFIGKGDKVFHESPLQGVRENFYSWTIELFEQLVMDSTR